MEADLQAMLARAFARCIDAAPRRPMAEVASDPPPGRDRADTDYEIGVRSFYNGIFPPPHDAGPGVQLAGAFLDQGGRSGLQQPHGPGTGYCRCRTQ
ncbi:MAG: hypothetical protein R3D80_21115 [Paracoccaceae bacterium]